MKMKMKMKRRRGNDRIYLPPLPTRISLEARQPKSSLQAPWLRGNAGEICIDDISCSCNWSPVPIGYLKLSCKCFQSTALQLRLSSWNPWNFSKPRVKQNHEVIDGGSQATIVDYDRAFFAPANWKSDACIVEFTGPTDSGQPIIVDF